MSRVVAYALLATASVLSLTQSASSADLTAAITKAPVPAAFNWTGVYVGGHVGYGWGDKNWIDRTGYFPAVDQSIDGILGGGQLGYNYQTGPIVLGIQGDMSWADIDGSSTSHGRTFKAEVDWLATFTGRIGYAWDRWLFYVKGGGAWVHDEFSVVEFPGQRTSQTRSGWTVGGGVEVALTGNWSALVEYGYLDFGDDSATFSETIVIPGGYCKPPKEKTFTRAFDIDQQMHTIKVGLNYRFR
jgi:outer membrane immunogenic protein